MNNIKDYLHLYVGCQCITDSGITGELITVNHEAGIAIIRIGPGVGQTVSKLYSEVKPILRHIFSITEDEKKELWRMVFSDKLNSTKFSESALDFTGQTIFKDETSHYQRPRYIMMQGVERLAIEEDGTIWCDCDLHTWRHNQHEVTRWLLSKSFDLFGLIRSRLAIDSTLKPVL